MSHAIRNDGNRLSSPFERLSAAAAILNQEAQMLQFLSKHVPIGMSDAVEMILRCDGAVMVTGMGKAGWIGQKISASFASTGTRSHFLHPAEAIHGDLGRVAAEDLVLALSNSGETEEVTQILPYLKKASAGIIAITAKSQSSLGKAADTVIEYGRAHEACHLGLAPSTSTTAMLALGDALALVVSQARQFGPFDFARFHPGGALGKRLSTVDEIMRPLDKCRVAAADEIVRDIYARSSVAQRRVGVILVQQDDGKLAGIFTDSDLVRLLERRQDRCLDAPISSVMTANPISIESGKRAEVAVKILAERNISELPVVDAEGRPLGIIDITDVLALLPSRVSGN